MDVLRNQIIERKVIERILEHATFKEVPYELRRTDEEAIDQAAGGGEHADIPEAKYDEGEEVPEARDEGRATRGERTRDVGIEDRSDCGLRMLHVCRLPQRTALTCR